MAQKTSVSLIDDSDGGPADQPAITFALDGVVYEIDLSDDNAARLREDIGRWAQHARRVGRTARPSSRSRGSRNGRVQAADYPAVRAWWRSQGGEIGDRGRIPDEVLVAFDAAQRGESA